MPNRVYVLLVLVLVYTFNFIDRQIVGILAPPIKADLGLTDTQLGLLGGLAFALFYTGLGIPIARLADRYSRVWIMTAALALWSGFTAACGFAQSYAQLFLARIGVGVGEAGGVAPAYSLVADYFPPEQRARALGVYSFGIPIGSALGLFFGGLIASYVDWRTAFIVVGLAGLAVAPLFRATVREPPRGGYDPPAAQKSTPPLSDVLRTLARKPSFWGISLGASCSSIMGYGLFFWLPSFFVRSHGLSLMQVSIFYGSITLIGGIVGIWLGGWLADRYGARSRASYALVPAFAFIAALPFLIVGTVSSSVELSFGMFLALAALNLAWLGPVICAVQHLVAPSMRATASAIFLFVNNLIGLGAGTAIPGALSDALAERFGAESLRYSILCGSGFYLLAAGLLILSARRLGRDWHGAEDRLPPSGIRLPAG
ncbi:MAG: spinster family MFS transporter [Gammaproteobacteria bacterium]